MKMQAGEIACCRVGMPSWIEHGAEAPLCGIAGDEIYRISYEPCWGKHVSICLSRCGDDITFRREIAASRFHRPEAFKGILTMSDWQRFYGAVDAAEFWSLPRYVVAGDLTLDGYEIIAEARRGTQFKFVRMPNPDSSETWRIGRVAFDLAGLADMRL